MTRLLSSKTGLTILGLCLIAIAIGGWILLPNRSEWIVGGLLVFGGFLVSQSRTAQFARAIVTFVKAWRGTAVLALALPLAGCDYPSEPIVNVQCIAGDTVVITDSIITGCVDPRDLPLDSLPELP